MSVDFATGFEEVAAFLQSKGVTPTINSTDPASQGALDKFTQTTGVRLPPTFSDFFTTFSNGYSFAWESGDESGEFSMPNLESLAEMRLEWVERTKEFADDPESMNQCVEPEFRETAFQIWSRMEGWASFIEESEGDSYCVDLASGRIVFDKHDWFDGFGEIAETNGMIAGSSLIDFVRTWGRFSFSPMWFTDAPHPADQTHLEWLGGDSGFDREN